MSWIQYKYSKYLFNFFFQEIFRHGSTALYRATRRRAFFREVTVQVPAHWSSSHCKDLHSAPPPTQSPSILVGGRHPVYGTSPWTLQYGRCGHPGRSIYYSVDYLMFKNHSTQGAGMFSYDLCMTS